MEAVPQPADPVRSAHARRNPTPWNKGGATARENSPYRSHIAPLAGQNSPCSHKMAQFGRFYPCRANFIPMSPATSRAGRTLYRMRAGCGASKHNSTPGAAGVEGAGGTGGHGRASRSTTPSRQARVWRSRGRPGPPAPGTPVEPQAPRPSDAGGPPPTGTPSSPAQQGTQSARPDSTPRGATRNTAQGRGPAGPRP